MVGKWTKRLEQVYNSALKYVKDTILRVNLADLKDFYIEADFGDGDDFHQGNIVGMRIDKQSNILLIVEHFEAGEVDITLKELNETDIISLAQKIYEIKKGA